MSKAELLSIMAAIIYTRLPKPVTGLDEDNRIEEAAGIASELRNEIITHW
jgi:hypothetical protein